MISEKYGYFHLNQNKRKANENESDDYITNHGSSLHEWTEEEFPFDKHIRRRIDILPVNNHYHLKDK